MAFQVDPQLLTNKQESIPLNNIRLWTPHEEQLIQERLNQKVAEEDVSFRKGAGNQQLGYIESWKAIKTANDIFGYNGWSDRVTEIKIVYSERDEGQFRLSIMATVRVTLKDGSSHEDIGYGGGQGRDFGQAFEKGSKEAVSDARKRALKNFGQVLGNSVYDKEFLKEVASNNANNKKRSAPGAGSSNIPRPAPNNPTFNARRSTSVPQNMPPPSTITNRVSSNIQQQQQQGDVQPMQGVQVGYQNDIGLMSPQQAASLAQVPPFQQVLQQQQQQQQQNNQGGSNTVLQSPFRGSNDVQGGVPASPRQRFAFSRPNINSNANPTT